jgi:hypothetical protein
MSGGLGLSSAALVQATALKASTRNTVVFRSDVNIMDECLFWFVRAMENRSLSFFRSVP